MESNIKSSKIYDDFYERSVDPTTREDFWLEMSKEIKWEKSPKLAVDLSNIHSPKWYPDGQLNLAKLILDDRLEKFQKFSCNTL